MDYIIPVITMERFQKIGIKTLWIASYLLLQWNVSK